MLVKIPVTQGEMDLLLERKTILESQIANIARQTPEHTEGKPGETTFSHGANELAILIHRLNVVIRQMDDCVVDPSIDEDSCTTIRVGHLVTVEYLELPDEQRATYRIVTDGSLWNGEEVASVRSPIGQALIGKCVGEKLEVVINGYTTISMEILQITI